MCLSISGHCALKGQNPRVTNISIAQISEEQSLANQSLANQWHRSVFEKALQIWN